MWLLLKSAMRGGRLSKDSKLSIKTQIGDGTGFWLLAGGGTAVAICGFLLSSWCCLKTPCRSSGCNITFSTKVSRGEPINTVDGEDDGEEEEGAACGEIGGTGGRSTAKPSKPIKAFIEVCALGLGPCACANVHATCHMLHATSSLLLALRAHAMP